MTTPSSTLPIIGHLRDVATRIRTLEAEALRSLNQNGDRDAYRDAYLSKIELLTGLPDVVAAHLAELPDDTAENAYEAADDFALRARQAKSMDSLFYMYALLYPEGYEDGQPNDLERFIDCLQADLESR